PGASVRVVVVAAGGANVAAAVARSVEGLVRERGRAAEGVIVDPVGEQLPDALSRATVGTTAPIILITNALGPWTGDRLDPLLKAIDYCDHVVGRRRSGARSAVRRWLGRALWRWVFAVPVTDVHSPCRIHRLGAFASIPLQSDSSFLNVEVLAKATFLGHLIDEVPVPDL